MMSLRGDVLLPTPPDTARHIVPTLALYASAVCFFGRANVRRTPHRPDVLSGVQVSNLQLITDVTQLQSRRDGRIVENYA